MAKKGGGRGNAVAGILLGIVFIILYMKATGH